MYFLRFYLSGNSVTHTVNLIVKEVFVDLEIIIISSTINYRWGFSDWHRYYNNY